MYNQRHLARLCGSNDGIWLVKIGITRASRDVAWGCDQWVCEEDIGDRAEMRGKKREEKRRERGIET